MYLSSSDVISSNAAASHSPIPTPTPVLACFSVQKLERLDRLQIESAWNLAVDCVVMEGRQSQTKDQGAGWEDHSPGWLGDAEGFIT